MPLKPKELTPANRLPPGGVPRRDALRYIEGRQPFDVSAALRGMQLRWEFLVAHGKHHFDQAGHACRCFEVSDICLDRSKMKSIFNIAASEQHGGKRTDLDRIA